MQKKKSLSKQRMNK